MPCAPQVTVPLKCPTLSTSKVGKYVLPLGAMLQLGKFYPARIFIMFVHMIDEKHIFPQITRLLIFTMYVFKFGNDFIGSHLASKKCNVMISGAKFLFCLIIFVTYIFSNPIQFLLTGRHQLLQVTCQMTHWCYNSKHANL